MSMFNDHRGQQDHIDSALAQALNNFEASDPLQQQQHQQEQAQQQQGKQLRNNNLSLNHRHDHHHHHHHHNHHDLPIDPSIADASHSDNADDKETQELIRNTAQAAVNSSSKLAQDAVIQAVERSRRNASKDLPLKVTKPRTNKPGQRFGAKKKSWVWNWFSQDPVDPNLATCEECSKVIKRLPSDKGSPKKLAEHLKTHKIDKTIPNPKRDSLSITNEIVQGSASNSNTDPVNNYYNLINNTPQLKQSHTSASSSQLHQQHQHQQQSPKKSLNNDGKNNTNNYGLSFDKSGFDQSPYSQSKFQKDLMKFLVDNKLPLSIVKSSSFRQVIFTLKPEAIPDLNELNHLYASLLEVINSEKHPLAHATSDDINDDDVSTALAHHGVQHGADDDDGQRDANVDDSLTNPAQDWV